MFNPWRIPSHDPRLLFLRLHLTDGTTDPTSVTELTWAWKTMEP